MSGTGFFLFMALLFIICLVTTFILGKKRSSQAKKVIPGAIFNNKDAFGYGKVYWVKVISYDEFTGRVNFTIQNSEENITYELTINEFVKRYVP